MARAIARCTCEKCGAEFEKIKHNLRNRKEANNWEEWAEWHYTTCDDCRRQEKAEEQAKKAEENGLERITVKYYIFKKVCPNCTQVKDSYNEEEKTVDIYVDEESKKAIQAFIEEESKLEIVEVSYSDYKNKYANCKQVSGSYNRSSKTIQIYVTHELKNQILGIEEEIPEETTPSEEDNTSFDDNNTNNINEKMEENTMNITTNNITTIGELGIDMNIEKYEAKVNEILDKSDYEDTEVYLDNKLNNIGSCMDELMGILESIQNLRKTRIQLLKDNGLQYRGKILLSTEESVFQSEIKKLCEKLSSEHNEIYIRWYYWLGRRCIREVVESGQLSN